MVDYSKKKNSRTVVYRSIRISFDTAETISLSACVSMSTTDNQLLEATVARWQEAHLSATNIEEDALYKSQTTQLKQQRKRKRECEKYFKTYLEDHDMDEIVLGAGHTFKRDVKQCVKFSEQTVSQFLSPSDLGRYIDSNRTEKTVFKCHTTAAPSNGARRASTVSQRDVHAIDEPPLTPLSPTTPMSPL